MQKIALLLAVLVVLAVAPVMADDAARFTAVMDRIVTNLNSGNHEAIYAMFNEIVAGTTPKEKAAATFKTLAEKLGKVTKISPPQVLSVMNANFVLYFERGIVDAQLALDSDDRVAGLALKVRPPAGNVPARQATWLRLPFAGTWFTLWGGEMPAQNYHVSGHPSQRYACDFIVHDKDGLSYKSLGKKNEDYYAFGRKVLAPAAGVVTDVIEGVRDNQPGAPNPFIAMGNMVLLKHRDGEYSLLAHLMRGSIVVKPGAKVKAGQTVGLCGNSGSSVEPQLHYSLVNTPILGEATGIKSLFGRVRVTRNAAVKIMTDYAPVKGDLVGQG